MKRTTAAAAEAAEAAVAAAGQRGDEAQAISMPIVCSDTIRS